VVNSTDTLTFGCACSNKITINFINPPTNINYDNTYIEAYVGIKTSDIPLVYENVSLGKFYATEVETANDYKNLKITAYDGFCKMTGNYIPQIVETETTTLQAVYNDLKSQLQNKFGIILKGTTLPDYEMPIPNIANIAYQQAIGYVAGCLSGFARFDRFGELEIATYTDTDINVERNVQYMSGFKRLTDKPLTITSIATGTKENPIVRGDGSNGTAISFENPFITDTMADTVYADFNNFTYTPCQLKWRGNPAVQAGDIIHALDNDGNSHNVLVMSQSIKIDGGFNTTVDCKGNSETSSKFSNSFSSTAQKIDRVYKDLEQKILDATKAITGNNGGYVILNDTDNDGRPDEILVMDYDDIKIARNVWRWNKSGLGHSNNGYEGPYETAITADGQINANFITTGLLSTERLRLGEEHFDDYINVENGVMVFGNEKELTLRLGNIEVDGEKKHQVAFFYNGVRKAVFTDNGIEFENLTDGKIRFQNFGYIPRESGNLTFTILE
jgi:hypothetical protein